MIDILDPLKVAKKIATTDEFEYIRIEDIENDLRDGRRGIDGVGAKRKINFYLRWKWAKLYPTPSCNIFVI